MALEDIDNLSEKEQGQPGHTDDHKKIVRGLKSLKTKVNTKSDIVRPIALRGNHYGNSTYLSNAAYSAATYRIQHKILPDIRATQISLVYGNFTLIANPNTLTVKAWIAYNGKGYQLTWGGNPSVVIPPGASAPPSDPLPILMDAKDVGWFYEHVYVASAGQSHQWPVGLSLTAINGEGVSYDTDLVSSLSGQYVSSTSFPANPTSPTGTGVPCYSAYAVVGKTDLAIPALGVIGDSISVAAGDYGTNYGSADTKFDNGFIRRALNGKIAEVWFAKFGDTAVNMAATMSFRSSPLFYASVLLDETGVNDFGLSNSTAQTVANAKLSMARLAVGRKLYWTTITPKTASTNAWTDLANQTAMTADASRIEFNTWLRAGAPISSVDKKYVALVSGNAPVGSITIGSLDHPVSGYYEIADTVESSRNSGKWKIAEKTSADGVMTSGSAILTSSSIGFTSNDVGKPVIVVGAGGSGSDINSYIFSYQSPTQVTLNDIAGTTVSAQKISVNNYTIDGVHPSILGHKEMSEPLKDGRLV